VKQGERPELSSAWWKKAQPEGVRGADRLFDALRAWEAARRVLERKAGEAALEAAEGALDRVESSTDEVIAAAAKLKSNPEMAATVTCLGKLDREIKTERKWLAEQEGDPDASKFAAPEAYRAYLLTGLKRIHAGADMNFAIALGRAPEDHRLALNKSKSAKSLLGFLVRETGLHQATFGIARADAEKAGTMVLALEGRPIAGLAKRATLMLKAFQPLPYKLARLTVGGKDAEDTEDDA